MPPPPRPPRPTAAASGHRTMSFEEFSQGFSGSALVCRRRPGFKPDPRRERRRPTVEMLRLLGTSKRSVAYAAIAGVALVVPTTAAAALASIFVDQVLKQGNDNWAVTVVVLAAIVGLLLFFLSLFQQRVLLRLRMKLSIQMSATFLWHLLRLPIRYFDSRSPGG